MPRHGDEKARPVNQSRARPRGQSGRALRNEDEGHSVGLWKTAPVSIGEQVSECSRTPY